MEDESKQTRRLPRLKPRWPKHEVSQIPGEPAQSSQEGRLSRPEQSQGNLRAFPQTFLQKPFLMHDVLGRSRKPKARSQKHAKLPSPFGDDVTTSNQDGDSGQLEKWWRHGRQRLSWKRAEDGSDEASSLNFTKTWSWPYPGRSGSNRVRRVSWTSQSSFRIIRGPFPKRHFLSRSWKQTDDAPVGSDVTTSNWDGDGCHLETWWRHGRRRRPRRSRTTWWIFLTRMCDLNGCLLQTGHEEGRTAISN